MARELHISSLIVHARPEVAGAIRAAIERVPGMEVHAVSPVGKMVVTLETDSEAEIVTRLNGVSLLDGVYAATLVFHSVEEITATEEAPHEAVTP